MTSYLDRLGARSAATRHGPVRRHRPRPGGAAGRVPGGPRGRRAVRAAPRRGDAPARRGRQAQPRVLRGVRIGRDRRARAPAGARPGRRPVRRDAKRGDIGSTAARQAVALFDALGADAVTVNPYLGEEAIAPAPRARGPVRVRPVPDLQPRGGGAPGASRSPADAAERARRAAVGAGRAARRRVGTGRHGRASSSARRRPRSSRRSARSRPGSRSSFRASAPRAARWIPCSRTAPRPRAPAGGRPGGGLLVNVSRGIARAALDEPADGVQNPDRPGQTGRLGGPRRAPRGGRRRVGGTPRCATLTPFRDGFGPPRSNTRSIHRDAVQHRTR